MRSWLAERVGVVRAVDHVTTNLQIGSIAQRITAETVEVIEAVGGPRHGERPRVAPAARPRATRAVSSGAPTSAQVVESDRGGWVQQIDSGALSQALPEGAEAWIEVVHGGYVTDRSPLVRVEADTSIDDDTAEDVRSAFALGSSRTMQRDIGFGISQLADIAVRALSPGVNDPQTAQDIIRHLGEVVLTLWSYEQSDPTTNESGRTIHQITTSHERHLQAGFDPIRRYGRSDPAVMRTLG